MLAHPILVVENDLEVCNVIEETLENAGFSVDIAHTGATALSEVQRNRYPAAIVDARLPDTEGPELFRRIKRHQPGIGGILLTRERSLERLKIGIDQGFGDVLSDPLNPQRLLTRVEEMAEEAVA